MNIETGYEAYGIAPFTRNLGMKIEEAKRVCRDATRAAKNKAYHCYSF